jgi:hypothetical protein
MMKMLEKCPTYAMISHISNIKKLVVIMIFVTGMKYRMKEHISEKPTHIQLCVAHINNRGYH